VERCLSEKLGQGESSGSRGRPFGGLKRGKDRKPGAQLPESGLRLLGWGGGGGVWGGGGGLLGGGGGGGGVGGLGGGGVVKKNRGVGGGGGGVCLLFVKIHSESASTVEPRLVNKVCVLVSGVLS